MRKQCFPKERWSQSPHPFPGQRRIRSQKRTCSSHPSEAESHQDKVKNHSLSCHPITAFLGPLAAELIHNSLMFYEIENRFIYLLAICISTVNYIFMSFAHYSEIVFLLTYLEELFIYYRYQPFVIYVATLSSRLFLVFSLYYGIFCSNEIINFHLVKLHIPLWLLDLMLCFKNAFSTP